MKLPLATIAMIKHHEGVRYKPYKCPAKLWTIGVGHVLYPEQGKLPVDQRDRFALKIEDFRVFSKDEVDSILEKDLQRFVAGVLRYCPDHLNENRLGALVSFAFNVGLGTLQRSTLRQKHNRGDFEGVKQEFLKFTKGGGKVLPGLVKRRNDEISLYFSEPK
jgi:lysozyme